MFIQKIYNTNNLVEYLHSFLGCCSAFKTFQTVQNFGYVEFLGKQIFLITKTLPHILQVFIFWCVIFEWL